MMAGQPQSGMSDQAMGMLNRMGLAQLGQAKMLKDAGMNNDFGPKGIGIETYLSMGSPEYRAMQRRLGVNNDFGPEGIPIDQWLAMGQ